MFGRKVDQVERTAVERTAVERSRNYIRHKAILQSAETIHTR